MKYRILTGTAAAVLGFLISVLPAFVFPVCDFCQSMGMKCVGAVKAEYGMGVAVLFLAVLIGFTEAERIRFWMSLAIALIGIPVAFVGKTMLCGGDCNPQCSCNPLTPWLVTGLGILTTVIFLINAISLRRSKNT